MGVLARFLRNGERWTLVEGPDWWNSDRLPHLVLSELDDKDSESVSFWKLNNSSDKELEWILASYVFRQASEKTRIEDIAVRFIDESDLPDGVIADVVPGRLNDNKINGYHRAIRKLTGPQAVELVGRLNRHKVYSRQRLASFVVRSISAGRISSKLSKEMLKQLYDLKMLKLLKNPSK